MSEYIYGSIGDPLANVLGEIYLPRVEVVRCRDCRYYDTHTEPPECYREVPGRIVAPDGFCKWGERE